jgi:hypothetical protein
MTQSSGSLTNRTPAQRQYSYSGETLLARAREQVRIHLQTRVALGGKLGPDRPERRAAIVWNMLCVR